MCSRDCRAACWTWLMLATPVRSRTEATWPLLTASSRAWPGVPLAPLGPACSSCPTFSATVILLISELTWVSMDASRCLVAGERCSLSCWAEESAVWPWVLVPLLAGVAGPARAAGGASAAAPARAADLETIYAALRRRRGLRNIARPPYQGRRRAGRIGVHSRSNPPADLLSLAPLR